MISENFEGILIVAYIIILSYTKLWKSQECLFFLVLQYEDEDEDNDNDPLLT